MLKNINFKFVRFCSSKFDIKEILKNVTKDKFSIRMVKSSGPGGQHVNKTNSKVELRFKISDATWLSEDLRTKLIAQSRSAPTTIVREISYFKPRRNTTHKHDIFKKWKANFGNLNKKRSNEN
nr:peptidyl-tRNA hydrolase ICT1, mitochondrial isoform X2 [Hydra vulgaris]